MIVSILVLILATVLISYKGIHDSLFFRKNEFHIGSIQAGEQFRMLSFGFLHADFQHLFFLLGLSVGVLVCVGVTGMALA